MVIGLSYNYAIVCCNPGKYISAVLWCACGRVFSQTQKIIAILVELKRNQSQTGKSIGMFCYIFNIKF